MKKIETIARAIMAKNPELVSIVENNPTASYKALEPKISQRFVTKVGKKEDQFISRNKLIWACINECSDEEGEDPDY